MLCSVDHAVRTRLLIQIIGLEDRVRRRSRNFAQVASQRRCELNHCEL